LTVVVTAIVVLVGGAVYRDVQRAADETASHAAKSVLERPIVCLTPTHLAIAAAAWWASRRRE